MGTYETPCQPCVSVVKQRAEINPASARKERLMRLRRENIFAAAKKGERRMNLRGDFLFREGS